MATSVLNKFANKVPRVPKCPLSARVPKCPSSVQVHQCLECPSSLRVPKCPNCSECRLPTCSSSTLRSPSTLIALSTQVLQSVSQLANQSAGLRCWFSKLISTSRTHTLRENKILRRRKLPTVV